jgi:1-phosphofructokinase/tagatose 6-phosphate kinase
VIVTVTLNAAIDRTVRVPNSLRLPGGKGVNVARALKALGQPVIATGLAGGRTGVQIIEELTAEGILNDFVRIADESRTSTAVIDPTNNQQTEINEYGPSVQQAELDVLVPSRRW